MRTELGDFVDRSDPQGALVGCGAVSLTMPIRYVRSAVVLANNQDWDMAEVLKDAGVSPLLLADARSRVTIDQVTAIAQAMWRHTNDELLGLSSAPTPRGTFRLVCYSLIGARDLREALERFELFVKPLPGVPRLSFSAGDETRLVIDTSLLRDEGGLLTDALLAIVHRFIGWLLQRSLPLVSIEVPYARPDELETYAELFGRVPAFDAGRAALVMDRAVLRAPIMRTEEDLVEFLSGAPAGILARREYGSTLVDQARRVLETNLSVDLPAEEVAGRLSMAVPTLRRRLRAEGVNFRQLREDLLRDAAVQALVHSDTTIAELAEQLGFSETSAFTRAFRRWTGMAPGVYRSSRTVG